MATNSNILGIDIGSASISSALVNSKGDIIKTSYSFHHGKIADTLKIHLNDFESFGIAGIAATSSTPSILEITRKYDNRVSIIAASKHLHDKVGSILIVGGEKFGLIHFDEFGNYLNYRENTSCAAGTGSFLDQQARRLNLASVEEIGEIAFHNSGEIPKIASRCAVFAKTDITHAQQEGYTLDEICDGLCFGLARNIVDTLFVGEEVQEPVLFVGGVSKNRAVVLHMSNLTGLNIIVDEFSPIYGAIGAALNLINEIGVDHGSEMSVTERIIINEAPAKRYYHEPLVLKYSEYPDFKGLERYEYTSHITGPANPVEVDIYEDLKASYTYKVYIGIDIGSTSTKVALMEVNKVVLAGFYTRTAGRPVHAVQALFEAVDDVIKRKKTSIEILGAGTTGSGRKLTGRIIGADLVIDEITAHARAASELNPDVDTIIEIGGQDSKFTTLKNEMVTFSIMNYICAAGTGSFIEEQAIKLGCPLSEYSRRAEGQRSPLTSDRCTVFMERDVNHYLNHGYSVEEVLASVLHSIRENYLTKVAVENSIGKTISFQGATAKNRALVAAFEQGLGKPIHVSRYCHLTGALGTALILSDEGISDSRFRGIGLYRKNIPIRSEICDLCTNHCKLTIAELDGESVAYGFLCGRDYNTKQYVNNNLSGFDLLKEWKSAFSSRSEKNYREDFTIGIPAALHLFEDIPLWKRFFELLSIKTVSSENYREGLKEGKNTACAEFCAPMLVLHGHVKYLLKRADYIFLPFYLDARERERSVRRQFCYYTQFAPSIISTAGITEERNRLLSPLLYYIYSNFHTKVQLYKMLKSITKNRISFLEVSKAYDSAVEFHHSSMNRMKELFQREIKRTDDISVVLVGRPYNILSSSMNNGIPDIIASMGIKTFYQEMLILSRDKVSAIDPLLRELHWEYASRILKATELIAKTDGIYPVFVTSFRCSPDSFVMDYFKKIMESHDKPYLILQLDEHDSSVGYETRIESAIRSFRNHHSSKREKKAVRLSPTLIPAREEHLLDKTLIFPNWDSITMKLIIANLRREGIDAHLLEETDLSIQRSLRHNNGQCIPLNIIAQEYMDYIEKYNLDPAKTALWMISSELPCNIKLFPHHIKNILYSYGKGMERAGVYTGELSFAEISLKLPINTYFAYLFGGLIRKVGCKIRPYEKERGITDSIVDRSTDLLIDAFLGNRSKESAVAEAVSYFKNIEVSSEQRPKLAIFGDLYARDNEVMNQNLINFIEDNGGEVITTPYSFYAKMIAGPYFRKWFNEGKYLEVLSSKALLATINRLEKIYYRYFEEILNEPIPEFNEPPEMILSQYNILVENTGESMDNILKIYYLLKHYPDISLFVQTSPAFCCPSLITGAMAEEIERNTGVPVVSITYDGIGGSKNEVIIPYLKYPRNNYRELKAKKMS
jgi:predicted CoA-substrate-specific enzyme activase